MKKFYNRKTELIALNKHFSMTTQGLFVEVVMGRRRIGKTELIKKYIEKKSACYFYVTKKSSQMILNDFLSILREKFTFLPSTINNWEDFFHLIFELGQQRKLIVIFDEFQNFQYIDKSIFSIFQKKIDEYKDKSKLHLLFIGSIQTMMERIFMQKEPLYGRIDNFVYLEPFNFSEIVNICQDHQVKKLEDIFDLYSMFNGVAKYYDILEKFDLFKKSPKLILKELFITKDTPFYKEGENLLIEEFGKDYERYFDILFCLSIGKVKINEVASLMQLPVTTISKYLDVLVKKYKFVEKRNLHNKRNSKDNRYYVKDVFLRFWFRYVYKNYTQIELEVLKPILVDFDNTFKSYQGFVFEELVRKLLYKKIWNDGILPFCPKRITNYWDKKYEFDIYAEDNTSFIIGEIKLSSRAVNKGLIRKIEDFCDLRRKDAIKVIITLDKITNVRMREILNERKFYVFDLKGILN